MELNDQTKSKLQRLARSPTTRGPPGFGRGGGGGYRSYHGSPTATGAPNFAGGGGGADPMTPLKARGSGADELSKKRSRKDKYSGGGQQGGGGGEEDGRGSGGESGPAGGNRAGEGPALGVIPKITLDDMGGLSKELPLIKELIEYPLRYPHLFSRLGADPPCGVLLHGPPGCGKTKLVHAIAGSLQVPLFFVSAPEIVSGISGDSEAKLRTLFLDAISVAPSLIFIDEIETIAGRRENAGKEMERRIVAQLLACMDQLNQAWRDHNKMVCVMGATNHPESIDSALRRAGRFDREIGLGIPSLDERISILKIVTKGLSMDENVDFFELANLTPGFVGADLHLLVKEASILAIRRMHNDLKEKGELENGNSDLLNGFCVTFDELKDAVKRVQPSAMREGFTTVPNVSWQDIGALEDVREELMASILHPIRAPKLHKRFGLENPIGVLLYGPPGCGKTLVAKAIANSSGANFISIKGPELLNKYVGESERSVRAVFARGRASAPCVLFFDELDALVPVRGSDRANPSSERVVNQLLTEMDGIEGRRDVYVIGATNRPDMIDPAMLRPGRLDKLLYVPLPSPAQRASILKTAARKVPLADDVDLDAVGMSEKLEGFSGADLAALMRESSLIALRHVYSSNTPEQLDAFERELLYDGPPPVVTMENIETAMQKMKPSVSKADREKYHRLRQEISEQK